MRNLRLLFYILSVILVTAFFVWLHPAKEVHTKNAKGITFNTATKVPKKDRMDLAWLMEKELTMDPELGYAPRERLYESWKYMQQLLAKQGSGKAAIPGVTWTERGPNNCGGRTRTILVDLNDPTRKTVWAGGVAGGLWKTTDITLNQPNWVTIDDFFQNLAITSIAQAPSNPNIMYFGTGEGNGNLDAVRGLGIWKSTNGGQTWTQLSATNNSTYHYCQKLLALSNGDTLFALTRAGLYRSVNGGTSFTKVLGNAISSSGGDIAQDIERFSNGVLIASMSGTGNNSGTIHKSYNNGATWTTPRTLPSFLQKREIELGVTGTDTSYVYALVENGGRIQAILKSRDGGNVFDTVSAYPYDSDMGVSTAAFPKDFSRGQAWYDLSIAVAPNDTNSVVVGGVDLFRTQDGGQSWDQLSHWYGGFGFQEVHADQHFAIFSPGNGNICYFANDGGVYRSADMNLPSPILESKEINYRTTQFYACDIHPNINSNLYVGGTQDNGSHRFSTTGINSTIEVTGGDGAFCHIDQDQPQFWFTSYVYTSYYRSTDGGNNFSSALNTSTQSGSFINPSDYDDTNNKMYLAGNNNVIARWDNPQTGNSLVFDTVPLMNNSRATHIKVSPNVANRIYVGTSNARIIRIDNANTATTIDSFINNAKPGMPTSGSISCIEVETGNENHILITLSNYGVNSVWETKNGGSTWTSVEGNLPDMPIRWILFNPNKNWQAMAATELGVWTTDSLIGTSTNWQPSNSGFSNVRTDMLKLRAIDKQVLAGTHGRGFFTSNVFAAPFADFDANKKITYVSSIIQFTSLSNNATSYLWDFGDGTTSTAQNPTKQYFNPGVYNVTLTINGGLNSKVVNGFITILPYRPVPYTLAAGGNFDSNPNDFIPENLSGTPFQRGSSTIPAKSGTASGSFAWVTGLSGNYANNSHSNLYTPCFNCTAPGTYTLRVKARNQFEIGYDGFRVEYSLDLGNTWQQLGTSVQTNWYDFANNVTTNSAFPFGSPFFNANRTSFVQLQFNFSSLAGNSKVAFRFVFKSDGGTTNAGVALDDFEITGPTNSALPVTLIGFKGVRVSEREVKLAWETSFEKNNKGFAIEKSTDGFNFKEIDFVKGVGNSISLSSYSFSDYEAKQDHLYYRLRQVDFDGRMSYSSIVKISEDRDEPELFTLGYMWDNRSLSVNLLSGSEANAELITLNGTVIKAFQLQAGMQVLNLRDLAQGVYLIKVNKGNGQSQVEKLIWLH